MPNKSGGTAQSNNMRQYAAGAALCYNTCMRNELMYALGFALVVALIIWLAMRPAPHEPPRVAHELPVQQPAPMVLPEATNEPVVDVVEGQQAAEEHIPAPAASEEELPWLGDELIVRVEPGASLRAVEDALAATGAVVVRRAGQLGLVRVKLPDGMALTNAEALFRGVDGVAGTERNLRTELPRDVGELPLLESGERLAPVLQRGREMTGLNNPAAETGYGRNCLVAVLDTGIDQSHPDLMHCVIGGYNFVDDNADTRDLHGHGTACAGIVAGSGLGTDSVKGIAPHAHLIPVKVMNEHGRGTAFDVVEGIVYAVERGARVISLSIGARGESGAVRDAIAYAWQRGVLIVAASGNEGRDSVTFPANDARVISVGAVDANLQRAPFSNYGDDLTLVAPGVAVYTTAREKGYMQFSGTSAAVPFVAGALAALVGSRTGITAEEAHQAVLAAADNLGRAGHDAEYGYGIINVRRLLFSRTARVYDMALSTIYFDPPRLRLGMGADVYFVVQNRGTRVVRGARLATSVAGVSEHVELNALAPSECVEVRRRLILPAAMPDQPLRIEGAVMLREVDATPYNNGRVVTLHPSLWTE